MKSILLVLALFCSLSFSFAGDISGTWGGIFYKPNGNVVKAYFVFLDIQQKGRTIWGVVSFGVTDQIDSYSCLSSVSATLSKKNNAFFELNKEKVQGYDKKTMTYEFCDMSASLSAHYIIKDSIEYLAGKWNFQIGNDLQPELNGSRSRTDQPGNNPTDQAGGLFVLHRLSTAPGRNIDQYFPKLSKMIEKGKADSPEASLIPADDISVAAPFEKRLIDAMNAALRKNTSQKP